MASAKHAKSTPPAAILNNFLGRFDLLARSVGLIQRRSRRFSAQGCLPGLLHGVCGGRASFASMAMRLAEFESASLSRRSFHQRLQGKAIVFLQKVPASVPSEREAAGVGRMRFDRVSVRDSPRIWMNRKNSGHWGGVSSKSGETAVARLHLRDRRRGKTPGDPGLGVL